MSTITQFPSGNTQYRIEFDYLARTFIVVTLVNSSNPTLNRVLEVGRDYRFLNPTMIEMLVDQSGFDIVRIHRQTGTDLVVDFRNGSVLTASDLTNAELQAIHIAEEGRDQTVDLAKEYADAAGSSAGNAKDSEDEARRIAANIKASGQISYITRRSFEKGFNVTTWNEVLLWEEDGDYYRWDGTLPKSVPAGSTPETSGGVGLGAWVSVGDAALRSELKSNLGFSLIGQLKSVSEFQNLTTSNGRKVLLSSWYEESQYGGGVFYYDSSIPKSNHDGGCVISPTVPYTSDANSADYVNGVGETDPSGTGCWIRYGVTEVTGDMYGMAGTPATTINLSPHFNKAIAYAGKNALGFKFPRNIVNFKSPVSIPMHQRAGGKVAYIRGEDEKSSVVSILSTATSSSNYGIYFDGSLSTFSAFPVENLTIKSVDSSGNRADWSGLGILFNKCIRLTMRNVLIDGFEIGCKLTDSLYLKFDNCRFTYNKTAIQGRLGELSGPNAVGLYRCDFQNNAEFCIENQHAHAWKIDSCAFEANGGKSYANSTPITFNSCVQFALIGGAGANAAHFDNCYFENNNGGKDISFYVNRNFNQIMNVSSCIFNYNSDTELASRILVQSNLSDMSAGLQVILNMDGNGFYNLGSASTAYRNVQFAVPSTFGVSHLVLNDSGNKYSLSSPFSGMEKVQRIGPSQSVAKAIVNAAGVGTAMQNIASISKTGTGVYVINFTGSIASSVVSVTFDGGSGRYAAVVKSSDYSVTVSTFNNTGGQVDLGFNLLVM